MRNPRERSKNPLRRWPERNFLAEMEPRLAETSPLDDVAQQDPGLRRRRQRMAQSSRAIRRAVSTKVWVAFADARLDLSLAEFELAFNIGFENGLLAGRALRRHAGRAANTRATRFTRDLRRLIAGTAVSREDLLSALLDLSAALASGRRARAGAAGRRRRPR